MAATVNVICLVDLFSFCAVVNTQYFDKNSNKYIFILLDVGILKVEYTEKCHDSAVPQDNGTK